MSDDATEVYEVPQQVVRIARDRTRGIVRSAVQWDGAAGIGRAVESAYLQGFDDAIAALRPNERARLARIASACGNPDPAEACRVILAICRETE